MTYKPPYRDAAILREWAADYERRAERYDAQGRPEAAHLCRKDAAALRTEANELENGYGHD